MLFTLSLLFLVHQPPADASAQVARKQREAYDAKVAAVKSAEATLARELQMQQKGASSELDVNHRRQNLALFRYDLATINDDGNEAADQLAELVRLREAKLKMLQKLQAAGAAPGSSTDTARRQVANARYLLALLEDDQAECRQQLQNIIAIGTQELKRATDAEKAGSASASEVSAMRCRLAFTNYLLHHDADNARQAIEQFQIVVAEREREAQRLEKLLRAGAASRPAWIQAQSAWLWSKSNLAILRGQRTEAADAVKEIIGFFKQQLAALRKNPESATAGELASLQSTLKDCELRLALINDDETPLRSLLRRPFRELDE